jgi:nucleoside-diphosphate-sugar epimerase
MRTLITGGGGFIGAWLAQRLHRAGITLRIFDSHAERHRVSELMGTELAQNIDWQVGDIANTDAVVEAAKGCDAIVHLAGVLTPACQKDPLRGAQINVMGTLNVFEAARQHGIARVIYTSSGGVFGPEDGNTPRPTTHYGAYKLANEGNARAYWEDHRISSIGMRPFVVYGPGRDTGLTAGPSLACRAAGLGESYVIPFTGSAGMVYVDDVAAVYEAAVLSQVTGAHTLNLTGHPASMDQVIAIIKDIVPGAQVRCEGPTLPSAAHSVNEYSNGLLALAPERSLEEGIALSIRHYQK